jgi:hypothetical protein
MEVVLAGDIIGSKKNQPNDYLTIIEPILTKHSKKGMYQIYRGDSFQSWMEDPLMALHCAVELKAALKRSSTLDVRIAIGIGKINLIDDNIAKSTGSALTYSGELLDQLKSKEQEIMIKSGDELDHYINIILKLALLYMNSWTENGAATIYEMFKTPHITQEELGKKLGVQQATASRRLDRANWQETQELLNTYKRFYKDVSDGDIN